jgi:hypothetical protein
MLGSVGIDHHTADGVLHRRSALVPGMVTTMMRMVAMQVGHFRSSRMLGVGGLGADTLRSDR